MPDYTLERVTGGRPLREFIAFASDLARRNGGEGRYVPPIRQQLADFAAGKGPYTRQGEVELSVVRDVRGIVVARTSMHTNKKFDDKLGQRVQLFGFTEFERDEALFAFLVAELQRRANENGRSTLFGPAGLLPNQAGGVITSGFDERGFVDSAWNPAYYPDYYESAGFSRRFEADTWVCEGLQSGDYVARAGELYSFDDARLEAEQLEIHRGSKKKMGEQLPIIREVLNASFAQLPYYTEISQEEIEHQTDGLNFLLDESLLLYLTKAGKAIAFVLVIPDITEFVMKVDGNLNVPNQLRLLATKGRYRNDAVLIIKGTLPEEQGKRYMNLLSRELLQNLSRGGYERMYSTFVERENLGSAAQYGKMGGRALHGYTFYERRLVGELEDELDAMAHAEPEVDPVESAGDAAVAGPPELAPMIDDPGEDFEPAQTEGEQ